MLEQHAASIGTTLNGKECVVLSGKDLDARSRSSDPALHVCFGASCPFAVTDEHSTISCRITGLCLGQVTKNDPLTAGIVQHADENGVRTCGAPSVARVQRMNPLVASRRAMLISKQIERELTDEQFSRDPVVTQHMFSSDRKRGAAEQQGVDAPLTPPPKRPFDGCVDQRELTGEQLRVLRRSAYEVLRCLTSHGVSTKSTGVASEELARQLMESHVKKTQIAGVSPSFDVMHNMCLRAVLASQAFGETNSVKMLPVLETAAAFAVGLWRCLLRTPHMAYVRRASDNFKAYASGVAFSMIRGVVLGSGRSLIPRCDILAQALPNARAAHRGTDAHQVHLSAHKGVSLLQKCLSSVEPEHVHEVFADALLAAEGFQRNVGG